jgi:hypothetical protein
LEDLFVPIVEKLQTLEDNMRAILYKTNPKSEVITWVGTDPEKKRLTKEYKSFASLYRYGIHPVLKLWDGKLHAEIYYSSLYKEPDKVMTWNRDIFKPQSLNS